MKKIVFIAAFGLALSACESTPSESPVKPVVCDEVDGVSPCENPDEFITEEHRKWLQTQPR